MQPIQITNKEFLQALAGKKYWKRVPISWGENSWHVRPAGMFVAEVTVETSNYFTVSVFRLSGDGKFARKKELFELQFVFVIDDVGTKLSEEAVRAVMPTPTYELETSPGNFQYGYKLTDATDARVLEALVDRIIGDSEINPSLKDPGMKGVTRVARLPVGSNNKEKWKDASGKGWPHVLHVWEPSVAYSVEDLAAALGVDLSPAALEKFRGPEGARRATDEELQNDPIMKLFDMRGMLIDTVPNDAGFVTIKCPWAAEHSDSREEAGYFPGRGGFQCHHGHCESRTMEDLNGWIAENATREEREIAYGEVFPVIEDDDPALLRTLAEVEKVNKKIAVREKAQFEIALDSSLKEGERQETPKFSEDWLAIKFVAQFRDRLRYVPIWGKWKVFDGTCWRDDDKLIAFDLARKVCRAAGAQAEKGDKKRIASAKTRAAVVNLAQSDQRIVATVDQWDQDLMLLNTPDGVVDLRVDQIWPHRPEDYMTKITTVEPGVGCPLFLKFLHKITGGDREYIAYLRRVFGYCLTGLTTEDALFFLYGTGANGKSTLLRVIKQILGDYAISSPSSVFTAQKFESHPTEIARFHNKRLVISSEIEPGQKWAESRIKQLTGGDDVSARLMRQDFFDFVPQLKLVIAGNHKPSLSDVSEAFRRRFHLLPFTVTITEDERDKDLEEKLLAEGGGILQWMIEGCVEWQKIGLKPPAVVTEATDEYLESQDRVAQWVEAECEKKPGAEKLLVSVARKHYNEWALAHNVELVNRAQFKERMARLGYVDKRVTAGIVFVNLVLLCPFDEAADEKVS